MEKEIKHAYKLACDLIFFGRDFKKFMEMYVAKEIEHRMPGMCKKIWQKAERSWRNEMQIYHA